MKSVETLTEKTGTGQTGAFWDYLRTQAASERFSCPYLESCFVANCLRLRNGIKLGCRIEAPRSCSDYWHMGGWRIMTGGRQRKSKKIRLKKAIEKKITLVVKNDEWNPKGLFPVSLQDKLKFKKDIGYYLDRTYIRIYVNHARHVSHDGTYVEMDLSGSRVQSPGNYLDSKRKLEEIAA